MDLDVEAVKQRIATLKAEHRDLDEAIDRLAPQVPANNLHLQRLKKRKLALKDLITKLENTLLPDSDGIYAKAKAVELEAERLLQRQLADRAPAENVGLPTERRLSDALANLALYVGDAPAAPIADALKAMAETDFQVATD